MRSNHSYMTAVRYDILDFSTKLRTDSDYCSMRKSVENINLGTWSYARLFVKLKNILIHIDVKRREFL